MEALVGVVDEGEGGDDQLAGHAAELPAEPFHVLTDALVPGANNTEQLDQGAGRRVERAERLHLTLTLPFNTVSHDPRGGRWTQTSARFPRGTKTLRTCKQGSKELRMPQFTSHER